MLLALIERQCTAAGAQEPRQLAHQIYMLFDGAIVQIHTAGASAERIAAAETAAAALLSASATS